MQAKMLIQPLPRAIDEEADQVMDDLSALDVAHEAE